MGLVDFDSVGALGLIKDLKPYAIDPAAWSEAFNMRFVDDEASTLLGRQSAFDELPEAPYFLIPITTGSQTFWVWAGATKVYVWDGNAHTEITRLSGVYSANGTRNWGGIVFGGIVVLNNGADVPQSWPTPTIVTKLVDLPNWPADHRAHVVRNLGPFLVALNLTVAAAAFPHRVLWSHPADPGSVPASWDITDPTKDTGQSELPDVNAGSIQDALGLNGQLMIYKQNATWRMRYVGGQGIFAFDTFSETSGILATRCVTHTGEGKRHFVVTPDDVVLNDGASLTPVLNRKMRRTLFNRIDPIAFPKSFCFTNPKFKEVCFVYPSAGAEEPDSMLIWNYETGAVSEGEADFVSASLGVVEATDGNTWEEAVGTWQESTQQWSSASRREVLVAKPTNSKVLQLDIGTTFDGVEFTSTLGRAGLAIVGRKRNGDPIVDFNKRKTIIRVYPRITGGPVDIRIGAQDDMEQPVRWTAYKEFSPETDRWVDLITEGAAVAIEFRSQHQFKLEGYKLDLLADGEF